MQANDVQFNEVSPNNYGRKFGNSSMPRNMSAARPTTGSMRRNLKNAKVFTKRNPQANGGIINVSKRLKSSNKKKNREVFNRKMIMTQSSPFIKRNIVKPNSPDRSDNGYNTRHAQSRVSRYNFNKSEEDTYNAFVNLIAMFDQQSMSDILEDVVKDAEDHKNAQQFYPE